MSVSNQPNNVHAFAEKLGVQDEALKNKSSIFSRIASWLGYKFTIRGTDDEKAAKLITLIMEKPNKAVYLRHASFSVLQEVEKKLSAKNLPPVYIKNIFQTAISGSRTTNTRENIAQIALNILNRPPEKSTSDKKSSPLQKNTETSTQTSTVDATVQPILKKDLDPTHPETTTTTTQDSDNPPPVNNGTGFVPPPPVNNGTGFVPLPPGSNGFVPPPPGTNGTGFVPPPPGTSTNTTQGTGIIPPLPGTGIIPPLPTANAGKVNQAQVDKQCSVKLKEKLKEELQANQERLKPIISNMHAAIKSLSASIEPLQAKKGRSKEEDTKLQALKDTRGTLVDFVKQVAPEGNFGLSKDILAKSPEELEKLINLEAYFINTGKFLNVPEDTAPYSEDKLTTTGLITSDTLRKPTDDKVKICQILDGFSAEDFGFTDTTAKVTPKKDDETKLTTYELPNNIKIKQEDILKKYALTDTSRRALLTAGEKSKNTENKTTSTSTTQNPQKSTFDPEAVKNAKLNNDVISTTRITFSLNDEKTSLLTYKSAINSEDKVTDKSVLYPAINGMKKAVLNAVLDQCSSKTGDELKTYLNRFELKHQLYLCLTASQDSKYESISGSLNAYIAQTAIDGLKQGNKQLKEEAASVFKHIRDNASSSNGYAKLFDAIKVAAGGYTEESGFTDETIKETIAKIKFSRT